jgi:hypothetical protein
LRPGFDTPFFFFFFFFFDSVSALGGHTYLLSPFILLHLVVGDRPHTHTRRISFHLIVASSQLFSLFYFVSSVNFLTCMSILQVFIYLGTVGIFSLRHHLGTGQDRTEGIGDATQCDHVFYLEGWVGNADRDWIGWVYVQ